LSEKPHALGLTFFAALLFGLGGFALFEWVTYVPSGDANVDQFKFWIRLWCSWFGVEPKQVQAIIHNEYRPDLPADAQLGDRGADGSPGSFGPMQCNVPSGTLAGAGFLGDPMTLATEPGRIGIYWGTKIYRQKLDDHGGDVQAAIKAYNGSGPDADAYLARANTFAGSNLGGGLS
jgi:hypothetical protein